MWKAFFVFMGSLFWVLPPPPEQNFLRALMNIWYCCALDRGMGLIPPPPEKSYKIARLEYIFDKISAFAKYIRGACTPEKLFLSGAI